MRVLIYRLTFRDKMQYVGQTREATVERRLKGHRQSNTTNIAGRLRGEGRVYPLIPCVEILHVVDNLEEADTLEMLEIGALPDRLKLNGGFMPRQNTPIPLRRGKTVCTWCGCGRTPEQMTAWAGRRRGYDSKCRMCFRGYHTIGRFLIRELGVKDYGAAYRAARTLGKHHRWDLTRVRKVREWLTRERADQLAACSSPADAEPLLAGWGLLDV